MSDLGQPRDLVFDATCLSHFARADRLDVLRDLLLGCFCCTTVVVREELRAGIGQCPQLAQAVNQEWLSFLPLDGPEELTCFVRWVSRIGAATRDRGEASVFAVAELRGAVAITDDRDAVRVARAHGLKAHGTLWLLCNAIRGDKLTEFAAGTIIDALSGTGMRLPCSGSNFSIWARDNHLLK
jgi:predicted nucleic acid-binding protein